MRDIKPRENPYPNEPEIPNLPAEPDEPDVEQPVEAKVRNKKMLKKKEAIGNISAEADGNEDPGSELDTMFNSD